MRGLVLLQEGDISMLVEVKDLHFSYQKGHEVLKGLDFLLEAKKIHGFLGHNGAGKTTLFLLLAGSLRPQKGDIRYSREAIKGREEMALVPENGGFFESLTVWENLRFRYLLSNQSEKAMKEHIRRMEQVFGLEEDQNQPAKHLSTGMKKRLALACALISGPRVLLLDEPTNGIDPTTYVLLQKLLKCLLESGVSILLSSHDLAFISKTADDIVILQQGQVLYQTPAGNLSEEELQRLYFSATGGEVADGEW